MSLPVLSSSAQQIVCWPVVAVCLLLPAKSLWAQASSAPAAAAVEEVEEVEQLGAIVGTVRFKGEKEEGERVDMKRRSLCGVFKRIAPYRVSNNRLMNVVISLQNPPPPRNPIATEPHLLSMRRCEWSPRVVDATVGQVLAFYNRDATATRVLLDWQQASGSKAHQPVRMWLPQKGQKVATRLKHTGTAVVTAGPRFPWTSSAVRVFSHAYHTQTDDDGVFELNDVPAGDYRVEAWDRVLGKTVAYVTVQPGRKAALTFTYTPEGPVHAIPPKQPDPPIVEEQSKPATAGPEAANPVAKPAAAKPATSTPAAKKPAAKPAQSTAAAKKPAAKPAPASPAARKPIAKPAQATPAKKKPAKPKPAAKKPGDKPAAKPAPKKTP